jgi:hypothetical protein
VWNLPEAFFCAVLQARSTPRVVHLWVNFSCAGTGKTKLANAIAGELAAFGVKFFRVSAPSLVTGDCDDDVDGDDDGNINLLRNDQGRCHTAVFLSHEKNRCPLVHLTCFQK